MILRTIGISALLANLLASPMPASAADPSRPVFSCTDIEHGELRFDDAMVQTAGRGLMRTPLRVQCGETTQYHVRLTSLNDCHLVGPRDGRVRYRVYSDPTFHDVVLNCNSEVEIAATGTMRLTLYALTDEIGLQPSGKYHDTIRVQIFVDHSPRPDR